MDNTINFLLNEIAEGNIKMDPCMMSTKIEQTKLLKKTSQSLSEILFSTLIVPNSEKEVSIALKVFLDILDYQYYDDNFEILLDETEGLKYEVLVYQKIISKIIKENLSPNFINYISFGKCDIDWFDKKYEKLYDAFYVNLVELFNITLPTARSILSRSQLCVLTIQKIKKPKTLFEILGKFSRNEIRNVFFQIIYSLAVMAKFKLVHNDLHSNNVLVKKYREAIKIGYKIKERYFLVNCRYIPFIFDWDYSYTPLLGKNQKIETYFSEDYNIKNEFQDKMDVYRIACDCQFGSNMDFFYSYYEDPLFRNVQSKKSYEISEDMFYKIIKSVPSFAKDSYYKCSEIQMRNIFEDSFEEIFEDILNIPNFVFSLSSSSKKYYLTLYSKKECIPMMFSDNMKTPLEIVLTEFDDLEVSKEMYDDCYFKYSLNDDDEKTDD